MSIKRLSFYLGTLLVAGLIASGCGGSSSSTTATNSAGRRSARVRTQATTSPVAGTNAPSEALSAATGDIPDNQVFLTFNDRAAGYSIRYPEGWARKGSASDVVFQDKANVIHVFVAKGAAPTTASASAGLAQLKRADPTVKAGKPQQVTIVGAPVIKITYTRLSAPDPVTGKRLPLTIDRYLYAHKGKVAIVDLGTPVGVDKVDAYRMISQSLRWR